MKRTHPDRRPRYPRLSALPMAIESLEQRWMLSTVEIFAAGETHAEQMTLSIGGQVVQTFDNIGGDFHSAVFQSYSHSTASVVSPNEVKIGLVDGSTTTSGGDRNLRIQKVRIDGVDYLSTESSVYVDGTWVSGTGCAAGNLQTDVLHCSGGFMQFAEPHGTMLVIKAAGATGDEQVQLKLDGEVVQTWNNVAGDYNSGVFEELVYSTTDSIAIGQVRVDFSNDGFTSGGADRNLRVDSVTINGVVHEAEGADVYSQGHWVEGTGCAVGFLQTETLECGGYFEFGQPPGTTIVVRAAGATGEEQVRLKIDGQVVETWSNVAGDYFAGTFENLQYVSGNPVTIDQVLVEFINDGTTTSGDDRNLRVDGVLLDGVLHESESTTVYSVGHWVNGVGCAEGFLQTETLECDGYLQFGARSGSTIIVSAAGATGEEQVRLKIGGQVVQTWNGVGGNYISGDFEDLTYVASDTVAINEVVVEFSNDGTTTGGADRNLRLDSVTIDGIVHDAESPNVYSVGHWIEGVGCARGFVQVETLECGGFFDFNAAAYVPGHLNLTGTSTRVDENAGAVAIEIVRTGGLDGVVAVDYHTFGSSAIAGADFTSVSGTLFFGDGVASQTVSVPVINDGLGESPETFSLTIDNPQFGATLLSPRTVTITIDDDDQAPTNALLAHWKLDETAIGSIINSAGSGLSGLHRNITAGNGPTLEKPLLERPNHRALELDGSNDFVEVGDTTGLSFVSGSFTFSMWMRSDGSHSGNLGLLHGGNDFFPSLYVTNGQQLAVQFGNGAEHQTLITGNVLQANKWQMVTATFDGAALSIYVDGALAASSATFNGYTPVDPDFIHLGRRGGGYYEGQLDEVRVYNVSLSAAQVADLFTQQLNVTSTVIATIPGPQSIDWTPDGSKMFLGGFSGIVKVVENGQILSTNFIDISDQVNGTRGLLDIAVHPEFDNHPYIYLAFAYDPPEVYQHTGLAGPDGAGNRASRLIRVTADAATNFRTAVPGSEVILLGTNSTWQYYNGFVDSTIDFNEPPGGVHPDGTYVQDFLAADSTTHTIGDIDFGPDGALYVANGDGASYNQVDPRAVRVQDIDSLSGKILRIDPLSGAGLSDNPFFNGDPQANRSKVYQYGLRNPFRISFNEATGDLYVGDVGWYLFEEVNSGPAGANFGWPYFEGGPLEAPFRTVGYQELPEAIAFYNSGIETLGAVVSLSHSEDDIDAVIVGDVVQGSTYGANSDGNLFFGYLAAGFIRSVSFNPDGSIASIDSFADTEGYFTQLEIGPDGFLYTVDLNTGEIRRWELVA